MPWNSIVHYDQDRKGKFWGVENFAGSRENDFFDTFSENNMEADIPHYLAVNFSLDKLSIELTFGRRITVQSDFMRKMVL
ncbi:hypothetical protein BFS30_20670 [Pedobacter steynii]|uniref:Uncharacterized protein n=1 Tax=Pedobacter steynii TaxID=430522 RepID=A0A1D7QL14_9SPHI|nr:hypothetical protein BFS30_20670 [Pedobacter steynii]